MPNERTLLLLEGREGDFPHRNVTFVWQAARVVSHCRPPSNINLAHTEVVFPLARGLTVSRSIIQHIRFVIALARHATNVNGKATRLV